MILGRWHEAGGNNSLLILSLNICGCELNRRSTLVYFLKGQVKSSNGGRHVRYPSDSIFDAWKLLDGRTIVRSRSRRSRSSDVVLETRVLVSRRLEDKNESLGLGLGLRLEHLVLVLVSVLKNKKLNWCWQGLDAFSSQSRSTNMVSFSVHCDISLSMSAAPRTKKLTNSLRHLNSF